MLRRHPNLLDAPALQTEVITSREGLARLADEWNAFVECTSARTVFLTWEWISAWLDAVYREGNVLVVAARDAENRLVAVAPFYHARMRLLGLIRYRCLRIIGDADSGAEYPDIPIRPGFEEAATRTVARVLLDKHHLWDCIWLPAAAGWTGVFGHVQRLCADANLHFHERPRDFAALALPETYEAYLSSLPHKRRGYVRRETRRLETSHDVELVRCETMEELPGLLTSLFALHRRRWAARGEPGAFARQPRMGRFYERFAPAALANGWLRLFALRVDGVIRAVQYGYAYRGTFYALQEGYDPDAGDGTGNVLRNLVVKACIEEGLREYDFLAEFTDHKRLWRAERRLGHDLFVGRRSLRNALLFAREVWPTGRYLRTWHPWDVRSDGVSPEETAEARGSATRCAGHGDDRRSLRPPATMGTGGSGLQVFENKTGAAPGRSAPVGVRPAVVSTGPAGEVPFTAHVVTDYREFLALENEWSELLEASRTNRVFLTHEWFRCWWESFGGNDELFIVCVRDRDRLVGVAPLRRFRARFRGLPVRKLGFLANDYSAEADVIVAAPEQPIIESILDYLTRCGTRWDLLECRRVRDDSPLWASLPVSTRACGLNYVTRPDIQVPYVTVEGSWESFLSRRSRNFRKALNRRHNVIKRHPDPVEVVRLSAPDDIGGALPSVFAVSSRSWKAERKRSIVDNPCGGAFFERLSALLGARGWVDLWLFYAGEELIAFEYHLNYRGGSSPIRADFDEAHRALSPGAYLECSIMRSLFDSPSGAVSEYNTCADGYAYELRWTDRIRSHNRAWVFGPSWYGKVMHGLGLLRRKKAEHEVPSCRDA